MADGKVAIGAGRFPAGTRLKLRGAGKTAKVDRNCEAEFTGLEPGRRFVVVGEVDGQAVSVNVTAKGPPDPDGKPAPKRPPEEVREQLRVEALERGVPGPPATEGVRSTATARPADKRNLDAAARRRSEASKKAARTRARNAKKRGKK